MRVEDDDPRGTAFVVELQRWQSPAAFGAGSDAGADDHSANGDDGTDWLG